MSLEHNTDAVGANRIPRRSILAGTAAALAAAATTLSIPAAEAAGNVYADPPKPGLPKTDFRFDVRRAALVIIDPQVDFLSPRGVAWGVVGESVTEHGTVRNIGRLLDAAKSARIPVAVSPHYYYPYDHRWQFGGPLEVLMHDIHMFDRKSPLSLAGFEGSGAEFMPEYKAHLLDGQTIIASPHKMYGPESNDLVLQLRKRHVQQVVLAGMSANLCVESHLRELLENGFEVAVVRDATAAAKIPEGDGYLAAIINFRYIANALWTTDEAVKHINQL